MSFEAEAPLVPHDEPLVDDTVYDLRLNHVWRRIVGGILTDAMEHIAWSGSTAEIEQANNWYSELIADFYDETIGGGDMDYLGANVVRFTSILATAAGVLVPFEQEGGTPQHDIGGFWDIGSPTKLTVPVGGAGYYYLWARGFTYASSVSATMRIIKGAISSLTSATSNDALAVSLHCGLTRYCDEGEFFGVEVRCSAGTRNFAGFANDADAVIFGMFRIGL